MTKFYSKKTGGFYDEEIHGSLKMLVADPDWVGQKKALDMDTMPPMISVANPACAIPPDAVEVTNDLYEALLADQSAGHTIQSDVNGMPVAVAPLPPTDEDLLNIALVRRGLLRAEATEEIAPLQDAVDLGDATHTEIALLKKWQQYRVAVNRVTDQEGWPREILWPTVPDA